ncbi:16S rRNA (uracil(1498)-N(3))-methyltransferase [Alkaliphilus serpentinus]|uniref:Ribosomal RNA small subunit methyltransferase E n=1 Tax=Alkaliphilus serpentinus TaxID=1482731 RepID=A0A833HQC5_9FIRM|nr:16S rRNA (uracil(1498)-N(3))-methyltransferase [Alkaliphilus serpentinus]KAB3530746.1 16S rRNA (uracil(1498)-N(3))-methyltransferase [Alkaliphilus serpentinus]
MNRFFVEPKQVNESLREIAITGEDVKHISKVLRLSRGDKIEICDGEKYQYIGEIKDLQKDMVLVEYLEQVKISTEAPIKVTLYQGVPKGSKMDLIIQKTTEMGIFSIVPVLTDRTVVQLESKKDKEKKTERWQKIALEAAKQSKRGIIPDIHEPLSFIEALNHSKGNQMNILAYEGERNISLKSTLSGKPKVHSIGIWVGPEGGYTEAEVQRTAVDAFHIVTLGPRILRTETAGFALLSMIMYQLGDLGGL